MQGWQGKLVVAVAVLSFLPLSLANAGPTLLFETSRGLVLYAEDVDQPWFPASLTNLMTAYVVFDAWKSGKVDRNSKITISARANGRPKMRLGLGVGKEITYDEAVNALVLLSANDIAVALAEAVAGSEDAFVEKMNATAERLDMTGTHFINANGLPGEGQYTTAKDLALLTQAILREFPEHLPIFSQRTAQIGKRSIFGHNSVLTRVVGGDGMKTGFTCSAGYNIVASATRENRRLVAIVLGERTSALRSARTAALLEHGFRTLAWKEIFDGPTVATLPAGTFDRELVRVTNLDKRLKACPGPEQIVATSEQSGASTATAVAAKSRKSQKRRWRRQNPPPEAGMHRRGHPPG